LHRTGLIVFPLTIQTLYRDPAFVNPALMPLNPKVFFWNKWRKKSEGKWPNLAFTWKMDVSFIYCGKEPLRISGRGFYGPDALLVT